MKNTLKLIFFIVFNKTFRKSIRYSFFKYDIVYIKHSLTANCVLMVINIVETIQLIYFILFNKNFRKMVTRKLYSMEFIGL